MVLFGNFHGKFESGGPVTRRAWARFDLQTGLTLIEMIRTQVGSQFDSEVVDASLRVIDSRGGIENLVMLEKDFSFLTRLRCKEGWEL